MPDPDRVATYRSRRDPSITPEPEADASSARDDGPFFVVQEHHASSLHWDLRLQHAGVLASWAVPKGLPQTPGVERLALHRDGSPFAAELPAVRARTAQWVEPELVGEVEFATWTGDGMLRQPRWRGLKDG